MRHIKRSSECSQDVVSIHTMESGFVITLQLALVECVRWGGPIPWRVALVLRGCDGVKISFIAWSMHRHAKETWQAQLV